MKKVFLCTAAAILSVIPLNAVAQERADITEIKIGATLCLSGFGSSLGIGSKNGLLLALKDLEGKHPFRFNIIFEDTKGDPKTTVAAVHKLADIDKVKIIIGPLRSTNVMAVAPIVERKKIILFTPLASANNISTAGDYVFRNRETAFQHGARMAEYLNAQGVSTVAMFIAQSSNSLSYGSAFEKHFKGTIVFRSNYNPESHDFKTEIVKALSHSPEAFYLSVALDDDAVVLVNQIRASGYSGLITGTAGLIGSKTITLAKKASEGILFTAPEYNLSDSRVQNFQKDYQAMFKERPEFYSANAYDALFLLANAVSSCEGAYPECIKDYLYGVKNYPGIGGSTTFDKNGDVHKPIQIMVIKEGRFEELE